MENNNKNQNNNPTVEKSEQSGSGRQGAPRHNRYNRHRRPNRDNRDGRETQAAGDAQNQSSQPAANASNAPAANTVNAQNGQNTQNEKNDRQKAQSADGAASHQKPQNQRHRQGRPNNRRQNNRQRLGRQQSDAETAQRDAAQCDTNQREANQCQSTVSLRDNAPQTQRVSPMRVQRSAGRPINYTRERADAGDDLAPEVIFFSAPEPIPSPAPGVTVKVGDPDLSAFDFDTPEPREVPMNDPDAVEVIGVRFRKSTKVYYFSPGNIIMNRGDNAIVETARGPEFGEVSTPNRRVSAADIVQPLRPMIRPATREDEAHNLQNRQKEKDAFALCQEKIAKHGLDMKLVDAQYTFDNSKLLFYFTSAGRVDFRELVKDLASVFRTRIELRQIGIRDEAKLLGGLGTCGRPLCCASFLSDFVQVSIKMAKEQNLSLNSNKISGACGRLMCCLRYENDTYEAELRLTPPVDSQVRTPDGNGVVTEVNPLAGLVKVKIVDSAKQETVFKLFHRDDVTVISRSRQSDDKNEDTGSSD